MSTILRDPTAGLLDIPAQPLGPPPRRDLDGDSRPSTVFTVSSDGTVEIAHSSSFRGIETIQAGESTCEHRPLDRRKGAVRWTSPPRCSSVAGRRVSSSRSIASRDDPTFRSVALVPRSSLPGKASTPSRRSRTSTIVCPATPTRAIRRDGPSRSTRKQLRGRRRGLRERRSSWHAGCCACRGRDRMDEAGGQPEPTRDASRTVSESRSVRPVRGDSERPARGHAFSNARCARPSGLSRDVSSVSTV